MLTSLQIRALRKRLKLSRKDLAAARGIAGEHCRVTIWRWETGRRKPSAHTLILLDALAETAKRESPLQNRYSRPKR
jgi:DNA-binding transcriptional regulator YiaG